MMKWRNGRTKSGHEGEVAKTPQGARLFLKVRKSGKAALYGVTSAGRYVFVKVYPSPDAAKAAVAEAV